MIEYKVEWSINVTAGSPRAAARIALDIMRDETSTATVFTVVDVLKNTTVVDVHPRIRVRVVTDQHADNPRENDDVYTTIYIVPNRYFSGDVGATDPIVEDEETGERKMRDDVIAHRTIYAYVHSGVTVSHSPFSCQFDSGPCGMHYVTLAQVRERSGNPDLDGEEAVKLANELLDSDIKYFDAYVSGEVYRVEVEDVYGNYLSSMGNLYVDDAVDMAKADLYDEDFGVTQEAFNDAIDTAWQSHNEWVEVDADS